MTNDEMKAVTKDLTKALNTAWALAMKVWDEGLVLNGLNMATDINGLIKRCEELNAAL